jgi:sugar phosphate isomerase/epimerase
MDWSRRDVLRLAAWGAAAPLLGAQDPPARTGLGIASFTYRHRMQLDREKRASEPLSDPVWFLERARRVGAGGIQTELGELDAERAGELRRRAEKYGLWIEGSAGLPKRKEDVERFDRQMKATREAGATLVRTVLLGGRRYETFDREEQFRDFTERSRASLELADPVLARHGVRLAFENHKDFRVPELLAFLRKVGSERIGVCADFANNFSLLEDNHDVVEALAPVSWAAHVKDMAVGEYEEGFLLADVPLGEGIHDLPRMVGALRKANPRLRFSLEMSARDPLRVPCYTDRYWATMRDVPGSDLARALRTVRGRAVPREKLPRVDALPLEERARIEEEMVGRCLAYARGRLGI